LLTKDTKELYIGFEGEKYKIGGQIKTSEIMYTDGRTLEEVLTELLSGTPPQPTYTLMTDKSLVSMSEGASSAFSVKLLGQPSQNVSVVITTSDPNITVNPATLEFTSANYNTYQNVAINALDNIITEDAQFTVTCTANGGGYNSVTKTVTANVGNVDQTPNATTLDVIITAGQSNAVCYTGANGSSLSVVAPEQCYEYRPSTNTLQHLQDPTGESPSKAGESMGYATGGELSSCFS
jgi:hypothetical protein